jgi:hypothetical protein
MPKRLSSAAPVVALTIFMLSTQTTALALLPGMHPNVLHSIGTEEIETPLLPQPEAIAQPEPIALPEPEHIAERAHAQANSMKSVGYCYRGVKRALKKVGVSLTGTAAWMAKDQLLDDERFLMVPAKNLRIGDIVVHGKSRAHPYGHIAVYLGDGKEASDHVQKLVMGGRYGGTSVFRVRTELALK